MQTAAHRHTLTFALAGNPNCGKTTLFNALTGAKQYVGNWPGVTVEKKSGKVRGKEHIRIVDLPGVYSLSPYSAEEMITREFLIKDSPDLIIHIVDANNLERNLYLTTQLQETGVPIVIALNMMDEVRRRGDVIDCEKLSTLLGVHVIPISASKGEGTDGLVAVAEAAAKGKAASPRIYSPAIEEAVDRVASLIGESCDRAKLPRRFASVKLLEGDGLTAQALGLTPAVKAEISLAARNTNEADLESAVADGRYRYVCKICARCVTKAARRGQALSHKIDSVLTHPLLAVPLFALIMAAAFYITFGPVGSLLRDGLDFVISEKLSPAATALLTGLGADRWFTGLITDGIIGGVGSVISFFPQILLLFFFLSLLEDSGYMARAAFIMDRALSKVGLSGKAFVPMLMGFGCSVPAILATRTLENERDRRLSCIIIPFMSCTARMPVYSLFISAFFEDRAALAVTCVYFGGILTAILSALLLKKTVLKGDPAPFVMELPPYRMPTFTSLYRHLFERVKDFALRAGTLLLASSAAVWFLSSFTLSFTYTEDASLSLLASFGKVIAPLFAPLGFGNWQSAVALLSGFIAKESIVSTLGVLTHGGVNRLFTPVTAVSFITFVLLYTPCVAAVSATVKEMGSVKWAAFAVVYQTLTAWTVSFIVRQCCLIFADGAPARVLVIILAVSALALLLLSKTAPRIYCKKDCPTCTKCG